MGFRDDDLIDDERSDAMLRRVLAAIEPPTAVAPPPDLVLHAARRLPTALPTQAAQTLARAAVRRRMALWSIAAPLALVALVSVLGVLGWGTTLALLIGDGSGGLSRLLLMLHLLAKPVLWTVGSANPLFIVGALLAVAGGIWLWWRTLQRTPAYISAQVPE